MTEPAMKPVHVEGTQVGWAASWSEAESLLRSMGLRPDRYPTRSEAPDAFELRAKAARR